MMMEVAKFPDMHIPRLVAPLEVFSIPAWQLRIGGESDIDHDAGCWLLEKHFNLGARCLWRSGLYAVPKRVDRVFLWCDVTGNARFREWIGVFSRGGAPGKLVALDRARVDLVDYLVFLEGVW